VIRALPAVLLTLIVLAAACDEPSDADGRLADETATGTVEPTASSTTVAPTAVPLPNLEPALWFGEVEGAPLTVALSPPLRPNDDAWSVTLEDARLRCEPTATASGWTLAECRGLRAGVDLRLDVPASTGEPILLEVTDFSQGSGKPIEVTLNRVPPDTGPVSSTNVQVQWSAEFEDGDFTDIWSADGVVFAPDKDSFIDLLDAESGEFLSLIDIYDEPIGGDSVDDAVLDVKARDGILYAATRARGVLIYDVRDSLEPGWLGQYLRPQDDDPSWNIHNIYLSPVRDILYVINTTEAPGDLRLLDVSDPANPTEIGRYQLDTENPDAKPHDVHVVVRDGREIAYLNYWAAGLLILDVTDPADVTELGTWIPAEGDSHAGWAFEIDQRYYYAHTGEGSGQYLTILDVTDLTAPSAISEYSSRDTISIHNVEVVDGIAYISYYLDGLRVVDLRDPQHPVEIGYYDTVPHDAENRLFQGAWGVHVDGAYVYVSDKEAGAFAFSVEIPER
jgi:choice-of-anchor B domain-containing protein